MNREGGEERSDGRHAKMEKTEITTKAENKSPIYIFLSSYTKIESMIDAQVARTTEKWSVRKSQR